MKFSLLGHFQVNFTHEQSEQMLFEIHKMNYFEGTIEMNEDGSFQGNLFDRFGTSTIKGKMNQTMLTFKKIYDKNANAGAAKGEIEYTFGRSRLATFNEIPLPGCWNGSYKIPTIQPLEVAGDNKGKTVLAMYEI